jgi:hypothetical protein
MVTLVTLCVLVLWIAFRPLTGWGGGTPAWGGWLEEEMSFADLDASAVACGA